LAANGYFERCPHPYRYRTKARFQHFDLFNLRWANGGAPVAAGFLLPGNDGRI
jgi:hypothetical protein